MPALLPLMQQAARPAGSRRSASSSTTARTTRTTSPLARRGGDGDGARPGERSRARSSTVARRTAELYLMQLEHVTDERATRNSCASRTTPRTRARGSRCTSTRARRSPDDVQARLAGGSQLALAAVPAAVRAAAGARDDRAVPAAEDLRAEATARHSALLHRLLAWGMRTWLSPQGQLADPAALPPGIADAGIHRAAIRAAPA